MGVKKSLLPGKKGLTVTVHKYLKKNGTPHRSGTFIKITSGRHREASVIKKGQTFVCGPTAIHFN